MKRLLSIVLSALMIATAMPVTSLAAESSSSQGAHITATEPTAESCQTQAGCLLRWPLSNHFTDTQGHALSYELVSAENCGEHTAIKNGELNFSEGVPGEYKLTVKATCTAGDHAEVTFAVTNEAAEDGLPIQYGYSQTPADSVKVRVTISSDGIPIVGNDEESTVLLHQEITVPYFDLERYDLQDFYRYETGSDGSYIGDEVICRPTALHLYIYLLERFYMGLPEEMCGLGSQNGLFDSHDDVEVYNQFSEEAYSNNGTALYITGSATSMYMQQFWGHDENLMYYRNHVYPLMRAAWGSTADYILLSDGDTIDLAMFTNWGFYTHGGFLCFGRDGETTPVNEITVKPGEEFTFNTLKFGTQAVAEGGVDDFVLFDSLDEGSGVFVFKEGRTLDDLKDSVFADDETGLYTYSFDEPGVYYMMDGDAWMGTEEACYAPATLKVVVREPFNDQAPTLKEGVTDVSDQVVVGSAYLLSDLQAGRIFADPQGDTLTYQKNFFYQRSTDGGNTWSEELGFADALFGATTIQVTETEVGTYMYRFYAKDDQGNSSAENNVYWTLTLDVNEAAELLFDTTFYVGQDHKYGANGNVYPIIEVYPSDGHGNITGNKVVFRNSAFGKAPENGETPVNSNTVVNNYNMFYASLPGGWYVYRAYGYNSGSGEYDVDLGGMQIRIPMDSNVDGAASGGTDIYLRLATLYTQSKKLDGTYFRSSDYTARWDCPLMQCEATVGQPYANGNYTYYPTMLYAGGNSCLYNRYVIPTDGETYCFNAGINSTVAPGYTVFNSQALSINPAVNLTVNVPKTADFSLFYQWNNFNTVEVEPKSTTVSGDKKTVTYAIQKSGTNYTWRMTDTKGEYVTKAGWLSSITGDTELNYSFENGSTDKKSHSFENLGTTTIKRDEADLQVFLSATGSKTLSEKTRVRAYRMWQLINSDTANIMIEPEYTWQILSGNAEITFAEDVEDTDIHGGNSFHNWADITANGTSIIAVTYDSIQTYLDNNATTFGSHGGFYPATDPARTGVIVVMENEEGAAKAKVLFNGNFTGNSRGNDWDYIYDTWYYLSTEEAPVLTFTAENAASVSYATVITNGETMSSALSAFTPLTAQDGTYAAPLAAFKNAANNFGGTVIIKMTDNEGKESYQLVHVAQMEAHLENVSRPGDVLTPGDQVKITFDGLYRSINKISGIFNPTTFYIRYTLNGTEVNGKTGQYEQMDSSQITLTIPKNLEFEEGETEKQIVATNGYVYGSMYSAANPFGAMFYMTDTGVGTNFNAVTVSFAFQKMADIPMTVHKAGAPVTIQVNDEDGNVMAADKYTLTITDSDGTEIEAVGGVYNVNSFGTFYYEVTADGYLKEKGSFEVSSQDASGKNVIISLRPMDETVWDGETMTQPKKQGNTYLISTGAELAWFAHAVNNNTANASINGLLLNDISLGGYPWTPIGINSTYAYKGIFDGDGHYVTDLNVTGTSNVGFFGTCTSATIRNLGVSGTVTSTLTSASGSSYAGGIVGNITGTTTAKYLIENCVSRVTVIGQKYTGGIAGRSIGATSSYGVIRNCYNAGSVTGSTYVGGITGGSTVSGNTVTIENCYDIGMVTGTSTFSGSVTGGSAAKGITNCYYLVGSYSGTSSTQRGVAVTADDLKGYAKTLGDAFAEDKKTINSGYPILTWEVEEETVTVNITVKSEISGSEGGASLGHVTGGGEYEEGEEVTVVAGTIEGYEFDGWYVEGEKVSVDASYTFEAQEDMELIAIYKAVKKVSLHVAGEEFTVNSGAPQNDTYQTELKAGTVVTLVYTGENFRYWQNSDRKIVSKEATYTFTLVSKTDLEAVSVAEIEGESSAVVLFVSSYNQVVESSTWSTGGTNTLPSKKPSKFGYSFKFWTMDGKTEATADAIRAAIPASQGFIHLTPVYEQSETDANYTVTVRTNAAGTEPVTYNALRKGQKLTLTAEDVAGKTFAYWATQENANEDGALSYAKQYDVLVTGNATYYAIYKDQAVEEKAVIVISDISTTGAVATGDAKISFTATRSIPEAYTVLEAGILRSTEELTEATMVLDGANVKKYVSTSRNNNGAVMVNIKVGENVDTMILIRGYAIVQDGEGAISMIYSEIVSDCFDHASQK